MHPILFAQRKIIDDKDWRPIRIRYFGTFVPKHKEEYYVGELQLETAKKAA